jgi:SNF2 family DNA or RNA helicase
MSSIQALRKSDECNGVLQEIEASSKLQASCKTVFVLSLLRKLVTDGHRTLVFSQSRVMLDILEAALKTESLGYCRIDGSLSSKDRQERVEKFQTSTDIPVFLLTSQVGGLGLTLTAADRVMYVHTSLMPKKDLMNGT